MKILQNITLVYDIDTEDISSVINKSSGFIEKIKSLNGVSMAWTNTNQIQHSYDKLEAIILPNDKETYDCFFCEEHIVQGEFWSIWDNNKQVNICLECVDEKYPRRLVSNKILKRD